MISILRLIVWFAGRFLKPFKRKWLPELPIECLVVGYGGANNTGAEARTAEAIRQMLGIDPRIVITLTSLDRRQTLRYLSESEKLHIAQINPIFVISILRLVLKSNLVVLIEGSCFKENFSSALLWFFLYAAELAEKFKIPTVTYGVDAGILSKNNLNWARRVANGIDLLMLRTAQAVRMLDSMGVKRQMVVTADTAFTLEPESKSWAETVLAAQGIDSSRPIFGIAFEEFFWWPVVPSLFRAIFGVSEDRYKSIYYHSWGRDGKTKSKDMKDAVARYADWANGEFDAQIVFFAMESLDVKPCRDVQALMKSKSVLFDSDHANAKQITALLRRLDLLVTCRYHALVLSMGGLVPVIGLAHDERIASIIDELGMIDDAFVLYDEDRTFDLLKEKTIKIRKDPAKYHKAIERALPVYFSRMSDNAKYFSELVKKRFSEQSRPR